MFQVRTIVTETAFSIDELEELYVLFKVSYSLHIRVVGLTEPFSSFLCTSSSLLQSCHHAKAETRTGNQTVTWSIKTK